MSPQMLLRAAFAFNIVVLLPVVWSLYAHVGRGPLAAFGGKVENVDGLRFMLAALWSGVAICSAAGLFRPERFAALLVFQVIYKALWLVTFAWPVWRTSGPNMLPGGVTAVFLFIVAIWPLVLLHWWRTKLAA